MNAPPLQTAGTKPSVCLCMIVKDEVDVLEECLDACRGLIDHWVICDTGSSDGTQELIRRTLAPIAGELHERPWVDFGHNRTELMALARGKADYLLLIDADCAIDAQPEQLAGLHEDAYFVRYGDGVDYFRKTLVSGRLEWRFIGTVHEYIHSDEEQTSARLEGVSIRSRSVGAVRKRRWERDAELLEAELERDPSDARSAFYLGQTYRDLGHLDGDAELLRRAEHFYRLRAELGGWVEETYCAWRELGTISAELGDWPAAQDAFVRAWEVRPTRLEAVWSLIVGLRERRLHQAAHRFASLAASMEPLPVPADLLFVEPWIYEWGLLFEYSITAYWCGEYDVTIAACRRLLEIPDLPDSHRRQTTANMQFAVKAKVTETVVAPTVVRIPGPGTPTRGFRTPDRLRPVELRAPGLAQRVAGLCGLGVQETDRRLMGLGPPAEVTVERLAPWPIRVRPGTSDVAQLDTVCNGALHLPPTELHEPRLIIDLGASIGVTTLDLARRYPTASLVAVELDPSSVAIAAHNLKPLAGRVTLVGAAIAATDGGVEFDTSGDPAHHAVADQGEGRASALTIDTLLEHAGAGLPVDYLKMSIEGSEKAVLGAGGDWPQSVRSIVVVPHGRYDTDGATADLRRLGFTIVSDQDDARAAGVREDARLPRGSVRRSLMRRQS
jgi:FkbM family methyltransferase